MKNVLILIGVIGLTLCGCQSETQPNLNLAIEAILKTYETALNASDTDAAPKWMPQLSYGTAVTG